MNPFLFAALCAAPLSVGAAAPACSKQSPSHTVALLELYTSEGCSSCPPADRFVSGLRAGMSPEQVVPLALHVDYWDYIGWKDAFARRAFTERQRWLSELAGSRTIYTPEIFVGGREERGWRGGLQDTVRRINARPAQASIGIVSGKAAGGKVPVEVRARSGRAASLFVALYQNGLQTDVKAGENGGVTLRHDYVVREWLGPVALPAAGEGISLVRALSLPAGAALKNLGVAAFVQSDGGEVLQALSLPLCE
ncbi:MAG TPA: DUF1223 domain-containing protein [Paucimonas sp.]|nr:DUF1223 domain-containing protein [Paucimonas sp.]